MNLNHPFFFKVRTIVLSTSIAAALLLQSCSSEKIVAPLFTPDPLAFNYAVTQTAEMQLYAQECSKLGSDLQQLAQEASTAWNQRNWPQSQVADTNYSQKLAAQTITYNNEKIALPAVKLYAALEKSIQLRLDQTRHSHNGVRDNCTKKLTAYKNGMLDLSQNKNADLYLKSLATAPAVPAYKVPALAGSLKPSSLPGRSQYALEKTLVDWDCSNGEVMTLRNEWPHEIYGAFCPNGKNIFVTCEWGECKTH